MQYKKKIYKIILLSISLCGILNTYALDTFEDISNIDTEIERVYTQKEIDFVKIIIKDPDEFQNIQLAMMTQPYRLNAKLLIEAGEKAAQDYLSSQTDIDSIKELFLTIIQKDDWIFPNASLAKSKKEGDLPLKDIAQTLSEAKFSPIYNRIKYTSFVEEINDIARNPWVHTKKFSFIKFIYNYLILNLNDIGKEKLNKTLEAVIKGFAPEADMLDYYKKFRMIGIRVPSGLGTLRSFNEYKAYREEEAAGKIQGAWRRSKLRESAKTQLNGLRQEKDQRMGNVNALWDTLN